MSTSPPNAQNPYAPPSAPVQDIPDSSQPNALAERSSRFWAFLIDAVLLAIVEGPAAWGVFRRIGQTGILAGQAMDRFTLYRLYYLGNPGIPYTGVLSLIWAAVTIVLVARHGQSIGKRLIGIKVVRTDGTKASFWRIFLLRNLVNGIPSLIPIVSSLYWLLDSLMIFGESRQCLHDKIAGTLVVNA